MTSKVSLECNICRNVVFSTSFALSRHQNWCNRTRASFRLQPHSNNQLHLNTTVALNDLNNFGVEEEADDSENYGDDINDDNNIHDASSFEMVSTLLNNTTETLVHPDLSLSLNLDDDTFNDFQFKYIKWQIKLGNLLNNSNIGINVENGKTILTKYSTISSSSSSIISNTTNTSLTASLKVGRVRNISGHKFGYPNAIDLIELFAYVKLNYLSNESGDNLLKLLHEFCERHPTNDDVFLHSKYRSIHECIFVKK